MEQLQRLVETIAETYIRDRIREHGSALITCNGNTGKVNRELLASGLLDNCIYVAKKVQAEDFERDSYIMLSNMLSLTGPEYQITQHGRDVIETMHRNALSGNNTRATH